MHAAAGWGRAYERECACILGGKVHINCPTSTQTCQLTCAEPHGVFDQPALDFGMKRRHALIVKWHLAAYKHVHHHTKAPYVNLGSGIHFGIEKLRRSKIEGAAECREMSDRIVKV